MGRKLIIYIASSWKNMHSVEMLTEFLEMSGCEVKSFVRNNYGEDIGDFDNWIKTEKADMAFTYDTYWATHADVVVYIAPSGTDAWAEVGAAWGCRKTILGLYAKGEPSGVMRKMVYEWFNNFKALLQAVYIFQDELDAIDKEMEAENDPR